MFVFSPCYFITIEDEIKQKDIFCLYFLFSYSFFQYFFFASVELVKYIQLITIYGVALKNIEEFGAFVFEIGDRIFDFMSLSFQREKKYRKAGGFNHYHFLQIVSKTILKGLTQITNRLNNSSLCSMVKHIQKDNRWLNFNNFWLL